MTPTWRRDGPVAILSGCEEKGYTYAIYTEAELRTALTELRAARVDYEDKNRWALLVARYEAGLALFWGDVTQAPSLDSCPKIGTLYRDCVSEKVWEFNGVSWIEI